jgi:hypothetical protein
LFIGLSNGRIRRITLKNIDSSITAKDFEVPKKDLSEL